MTYTYLPILTVVAALLALGVSLNKFSTSQSSIPGNAGQVHYNKVDQTLFASLAAAVGPGRAFWKLSSTSSTAEELRLHSTDHSYHEASMPEAVVYPSTTSQVAAVVKLCHHHRVPITVAGARTGLEAGAVPELGGVVVDMSKMDNVLELYEEDLMVAVQAGIRKSVLGEWLKPRGFMFMVDPGSDATVGGYASTGASGTLSIKYGTMRENVISMKVVLPTGEVISTRSRVVKSSVGYDLNHLFIGSEGTLGIITELTVRIRAVPKAVKAGILLFGSVSDASSAVAAFLHADLPSLARCELLNVEALEAVNSFFNKTYDLTPTLFLEFHAPSFEEVEEEAKVAVSVAQVKGLKSYRFADEEKERDMIWHARRSAYFAAAKYRQDFGRHQMRLWVTDVCVPLSHLAQVISETEADFIQSPVKLPCPIVGHVADGNFHCLVPFNSSDDQEVAEMRRLNQRLVERALAHEGTASGEHGVGMGKIDALYTERGLVATEAMVNIKRALDPHMIMNPKKLFRSLSKE